MFRNLVVAALAVFSLFLPIAARAALPERPLPAALTPALDHLLLQVGPGSAPPLEVTLLEPLLDFILGGPQGALFYDGKDRQGTTSAFHAFPLKSDLELLLRYAFNPDIPPHVFAPSSLRLGRWTEIDGADRLPRLWEKLPQLQQPLVLHGSEREEITPDLATGTYFAYDLHRTIILLQWRGQPVLIALGRQKDRSEVGLKGATLGTDSDWDYLYSRETGVGVGGLGWVKSYMYEAFSVNVFCQTGEGEPLLRAGIFKWLNAGWRGFNMVRRHHIHQGLVRYADDLQALLESPRLPPPDELGSRFALLARFSTADLRRYAGRYLQGVERRYAGERALGRGGLDQSLSSGAYLEQLSREELLALLALELMKGVLGRSGADLQLLQAVSP